jgi:uncharacterized protein Yka (UPF0111/DUF47 family)
MPGNPRGCRQHASHCVRFSQLATTHETRDHFIYLANTWIRLAEDLERAYSLLDEASESERSIEPDKPAKKARARGSKRQGFPS